MSIFGIRVKAKREELGMTQEELANKLGYKSRSSINKVELGINDISLNKVVEFASVLGVSPAYLMGWEEEPVETQLKRLRYSFNLSPEEFVIQYNQKYSCDLTTEKLRRIEDGHEKPNGETLINLADFYNVTTDYILELTSTLEKSFSIIEPKEKSLISNYRNLSDQGKEYILQTMEMAVKTYKKDSGATNTKIS